MLSGSWRFSLQCRLAGRVVAVSARRSASWEGLSPWRRQRNDRSCDRRSISVTSDKGTSSLCRWRCSWLRRWKHPELNQKRVKVEITCTAPNLPVLKLETAVPALRRVGRCLVVIQAGSRYRRRRRPTPPLPSRRPRTPRSARARRQERRRSGTERTRRSPPGRRSPCLLGTSSWVVSLV